MDLFFKWVIYATNVLSQAAKNCLNEETDKIKNPRR